MSEFDKTTERLCVDFTVAKYNPESMKLYSPQVNGMLQVAHASGVMSGRNSAKKSLEILANALFSMNCQSRFKTVYVHDDNCNKCKAIAAVKSRGDWCLENE